MQLLIYHGPVPRKPLVAIGQLEWEGATLGVGTIDLKGNLGLTELVYECVGAAYNSLWKEQLAEEHSSQRCYVLPTAGLKLIAFFRFRFRCKLSSPCCRCSRIDFHQSSNTCVRPTLSN